MYILHNSLMATAEEMADPGALRALRDIRKLAPGIRRTIAIVMDQLAEDPRSGDRLHGGWEGYWKPRTGEHRITFRIVGPGSVEIQYVRHRREAYRR